MLTLETAVDPAAVQRREDMIQGQPPRVQPIEHVSDDLIDLVRPPSGYGRAGEIPEVFRIMLHNPELLRNHRRHGTYFLIDGTLDARVRELAILRTAWLSQAPFEWGEHVAIAKKAGVTAEEVERVISGSTAAGWSDFDRAIIAAVEELLSDAMISDSVWSVLAENLNEAQLLEFPMLVGQYQSVAFFQNSLRIPLRADNPGLTAR